jgi:flagellar hook-length control protein FliK
MTAPVASPSMNVPDAGAMAAAKSAAQAPSGATFDDVLTGLAQSPGSGFPQAANSSSQAENVPAGAAALEVAASALAAAQAPWTAQLEASPLLPLTPAGDQAGKAADPRSKKVMSDDAPADLPQTDPAATLNAASALALAAMPPLPVPASANTPDSTPPAQITATEPFSPTGMAGAASAPSQANAPPPVQTAPQMPDDDEADAPALEAKAPPPTAAQQNGKPVPQHLPENPDNQNAGTAQDGASNAPVATSHNSDGNPSAGQDHRAEIALDVALAKLTQLATPGLAAVSAAASNAPTPNPVPPAARSNAADESRDRTESGRAARAAAPGDFAAGLASTDGASDRAEKSAGLAGHADKSDNISVLPDDSSRTAAAAPHAGNSQNLANPVAPQANLPVPNAVTHTGLDTAVSQLPNSSHGASGDLAAPVKLAFAPAAAAADVSSGLDALALRIAAHSADGDRNFSIRLDPPELGRIEVNLNVNSQGHAEAEFSADRPQTLELLQRDASSLERALKDAGLNLAGGLAFSLKGEGRSGGWRDPQGSARGRALQIAAVDAARASSAIVVGAGSAAQAYGFSASHLDIRV